MSCFEVFVSACSSLLNIFFPFQQKSFRGNIQKEFTQWLRTCNENFDKQIKFVGFKEIKTRTDVPTKKMQHPWAVFSAIEWGGKTYKTGQLVSIYWFLSTWMYVLIVLSSIFILISLCFLIQVKTHNTNPILYGKVVQFLLYGNFDGDVYATGGQVEVSRVRKQLWNFDLRNWSNINSKTGMRKCHSKRF